MSKYGKQTAICMFINSFPTTSIGNNVIRMYRINNAAGAIIKADSNGCDHCKSKLLTIYC